MNASGQLVGYARVSSGDQDAQLQIDALHAAGCVKVFADKASGKSLDRPQLDKTLAYLREGDTLVVWKLDRLSRSLIDLVSLVDDLRKLGIGFKVLTGALASVDTTTADGRLFFTIIAGMAEFERELIRERTRAGLEAAKAQGRTGGRPAAMSADQITMAKALQADGKSMGQIAKALGVGKTTVHRYLTREAA